ncbi:restriction endonuclease subunit S [Klebsiella pneumoniae]|uniref:restriction endonuclease subunit S n=1 Tax=Klebsiella quasipneumoniae TaxID=1463165 RepID=UPI001FB81540|nr:restriction endonuclease subunit S [Klebsiella quasipneumoniae subsp. similipneumoniae]HBR4783646.1 restriction endonuclease subunit S [Klebsiella pneumoniae]HBS7026891.1 restriction endonuclease subunit S [Klebsiella pneumoniae]HCB0313821.1 restriction endonuclease subunit S [Klebsiella pneumoniae]
MNWPMVKLGDVCTINPRLPKNANPEQEVTFLAMAAVSEKGEISSQETRILHATKKGFTYFERGDVLMAKITPCFENGKATLTNNLNTQIGFGSTEFHVLRAIPDLILPEFIFYLIWNERFRIAAAKEMTGSAGQKRVSADYLKEYKFYLPSIFEQEKIVSALNKGYSIHRKRQQAIKLADDFLRATFLEMFGDPVENPKGWQRMKFSEVGTLDRGKSKHRPRNAPELLGGIHPLIQTGDVANSGGYITEYFSTYSDIGLAQSKMWGKGTLCITIAANIAKTGILTFNACFPDSVVGFQPNQHVEVEFIQHWLGFLQKQLEESAPEVAQKNINLAILRDLDVIVPDKALQMKFKDVVKKVRELKEKYHNFPDIQSALSSFHLS